MRGRKRAPASPTLQQSCMTLPYYPALQAPVLRKANLIFLRPVYALVIALGLVRKSTAVGQSAAAQTGEGTAGTWLGEENEEAAMKEGDSTRHPS